VSRCGLTPDEAEVRDDRRDFYGKTYWLTRQQDELSLPDIYERTRLDLPERCLYWLRTLLAYALPPAQILELGSGHGGFVALMRWAGFDASGLEVSPWVVDFARKTFDVPMLLGKVETQSIPERSLDIIVLNDVLEHLVHPLESMRRCATLLRPHGMVLVQTPCYPDPKTHQELVDADHPFLAMLQEREHSHLFSPRGVRRLFEQVGLGAIRFESALFAYDMYLLAGRQEPALTKAEERDEALLRSPTSRMVRAMLDIDERARDLSNRVRDVEGDRQERIQMIERLNRHIEQTSGDYEARLKVIQEQQATIERLNRHIEQTSGDYEARLKVIQEQQATIERLARHIEQISGDYEARLKVIQEQQATIERLARHIEQTSGDYEARLKVIQEQQATIERLTWHIEQTKGDYEARLKIIQEQQATIERLHSEIGQAAVELEARQRVMDERASAITLLREQAASIATGLEAQLRAIAIQQSTLEAHIEQRAARVEERLADLESRQTAVDTLVQTRLVRLLRYWRLL
jgi:2-polyprenyl-3-methyl-5-hydroxy-6-metoxy-1,4-benzoquinol methylase/uncharacterized protein YerC